MEFPAKEVIESVNNGRCILFLGAMASAATPSAGLPFVYVDNPPSGAELSRRLAAAYNYPYPDITNLQRVGLFIETQPAVRRIGLINTIRSEITGPKIIPSPALHMLAALPFRFIITT
ncbi:MAG TPA: hypothetical protein VGO69_06815, partial [Pyrinomonadaceae bacterium]|nr:hypothetical protein [Pyrinomonadaceae bacterium]